MENSTYDCLTIEGDPDRVDESKVNGDLGSSTVPGFKILPLL